MKITHNLTDKDNTVYYILRVDDLLRTNWSIFNHMHDSTYSNEDKEWAMKKYFENFNEIRSILDVKNAYKIKQEQESLQRVLDIKDSQEYVEALNSIVIQELTSINNVIEYDYPEPDTTKEQWVESLEKISNTSLNSIVPPQKFFVDEDILNAAKGFMIGPVGIFRSKCIAAESKTFPTLEELKQYILNESKERDMVLYMTYTRSQKYFGTVDVFASPEEVQKLPNVTVYTWRGVFVDKQV